MTMHLICKACRWSATLFSNCTSWLANRWAQEFLHQFGSKSFVKNRWLQTNPIVADPTEILEAGFQVIVACSFHLFWLQLWVFLGCFSVDVTNRRIKTWSCFFLRPKQIPARAAHLLQKTDEATSSFNLAPRHKWRWSIIYAKCNQMFFWLFLLSMNLTWKVVCILWTMEASTTTTQIQYTVCFFFMSSHFCQMNCLVFVSDIVRLLTADSFRVFYLDTLSLRIWCSFLSQSPASRPNFP